MTKRLGLILLLGVIWGWAFPILVAANVYIDPNNEFIVTNTSEREGDYWPRISGSKVTWDSQPSGGSSDVYYRTIPNESPVNITNAPQSQYWADISGNTIVYYDSRPEYGVMAFNIGGSNYSIDTGGDSPRISGDLVVFRRSTDVYGKYLSGGSSFSICNASGMQNVPSVAGNIVVWEDNRSSNPNIYAKQLPTGPEFPVCTAIDTQTNPNVWGNTIVWEDRRNYPGIDVYGYRIDKQQEFPIAIGPANAQKPSIYGNYVVYTENGYVKGYSLLSGQTFDITKSTDAASLPDIDGNTVIWRESRNPSTAPDIFGNYLIGAIPPREYGAIPNPTTFNLSSPSCSGPECGIVEVTLAGWPDPYGHPILLVRSEEPMEWDVENGRTYPRGGVTEGIITFLENSATWQTPRLDYYLEPGQTYYYRIYTADYDGLYSREWTKSIVVSGTPRPIRAPTNVYTESLDGKAIIHLTNPSDPNYASTLIARSTNSIGWLPVDGQSYSLGQEVQPGVIVLSNSAGTTAFLDTDLCNDQTYYYRVYSVNQSNQYSIGKQVTAIPERKPAGRLYRMVNKWGGLGTNDWQFSSDLGPRGITVDNGHDRLFVSDYGNKCFKWFTKDGVFVQKCEGSAGGKYQLDELHYNFGYIFGIGKYNDWVPTYLYQLGIEGGDYLRQHQLDSGPTYASITTGHECTILGADTQMIYVCITTTDKVKKYYMSMGNLTYQKEWGTSGTNPGQLSGPLSIVMGKDNCLYVGDETGRIQKFGANGYFYKIVCQLDPAKKELPLDMAVDKWGCFYVATSAYRVLKFDPDWNFLTGWGRRGSGDGEFCRSARLCVDLQGNVYVSDGDHPGDPTPLQNQRVQVFTETDQHGSDVTFTGYIAEPVNTATGNFAYEHTDLTIPGPGLSFKFERFYNSQDDAEGVFGKGWRHSYEMRASETDDGSVVINWPNGHYDAYELDGGVYIPKLPGVYNTLVKNPDDTFTLTRTDQLKYNFATSGWLENITDRNGNAITMSRLPTGRLNTIIDAVGRQFTLTYDENGRLASLTDLIGRSISYTFNTNYDLADVVDPCGHATQYLYDSTRRITKIVNPRQHTLLENTYDQYNRVVLQKDAKDNETAFDYKTVQIETPYGLVTAYAGITEVNDALGHITRHEYDGLSRLPKVVAADSSTTQSQYDTNDNRTAWTDEADITTSYEYDFKGNVTQKIDPNGRTTAIIYDAYNNPLQKIDALGNVTTYTYDVNGNLVDVNDPLGNITHRTYYSNGLVHTLTDPNGNTTTFEYDIYGNLEHVTDALGRITTYTYDIVGRKLSTTDPLGNNTTYQYDGCDNLTKVTNPNGRSITYEYDENGNKTKEIYPDGTNKRFTYDELDLLITTIDEANYVATYEYDALGHLIEVNDPCGNTTTYTYDEVGNRISITDARDNTTTYGYDSRGNLIDVYDPNGGHTSYEYDALNRRTSVINPLGYETRYEYDALGRVTRITDPNSHCIINTYDTLGRLTSAKDKNENITSYDYDAVGNLIKVIEPNSIETIYTYDAVGNRISTTDPIGRTITFEYDALNRLIRTTDPLGHTTETVYDEVGRVIEKIDAKGRITKYDYDLRDRLIRVTDPAGYQTNYSYDIRGNLISILNARGKETTYKYDALNRLVKQTNPLGLERFYQYDEVGNKTALVDEDGQVTTYSYDENNRMIQESFPDGNSVHYEYDLAGQLIRMTDSTGVTTYQYDSKGQLNSKTDPFSQTISYTYDPMGNKASITYPGDKTVNYFYDQYNDLALIGDWFGNVTQYSYDEAGQLVEVDLPNGDYTIYDYDNAGRLVRQKSQTDSNQLICEYTIELDEVGNRIAIDYNQPITPIPPTVDEIVEYTYDDADRLISAGDVNYVFSNRGNLIQKDSGTETTNYTYDSHDWLTQIATLAEQWLYDYDAQGHRVEETSSGGTKQFTIEPTTGDMWNVVSETDNANTQQVYYIYSNGLAYLIDAATDQPLYYHYDPIGSTVALTNSSGTVVESYSYEEFGKRLGCSCSAANPYQYVGKYGVALAPTGLLYMRARYYDLQNGRFLTTDPLSGDYLNLGKSASYLYAENSPINGIDPTGLVAFFGVGDILINNLSNYVSMGPPLLQSPEISIQYDAEAIIGATNAIIGLFGRRLSTQEEWQQTLESHSKFWGNLPDVIWDKVSGANHYTTEERLHKLGFIERGEGVQGVLILILQNATGQKITIGPFTEKVEGTYVDLKTGCEIIYYDEQGHYYEKCPFGQPDINNKESSGVDESTGDYGRQATYYRAKMMDPIENWKSPSGLYIPERYEPKFRIINKDNAKDLRK